MCKTWPACPKEPLLCYIWGLERLLAQGAHACDVASLAVGPINQSGMSRVAIVPDDDGILLPLHAHMKVRSLSYMIKQKFEKHSTLLFLETHNLTGRYV